MVEPSWAFKRMHFLLLGVLTDCTMPREIFFFYLFFWFCFVGFCKEISDQVTEPSVIGSKDSSSVTMRFCSVSSALSTQGRAQRMVDAKSLFSEAMNEWGPPRVSSPPLLLSGLLCLRISPYFQVTLSSPLPGSYLQILSQALRHFSGEK